MPPRLPRRRVFVEERVDRMELDLPSSDIDLDDLEYRHYAKAREKGKQKLAASKLSL